MFAKTAHVVHGKTVAAHGAPVKGKVREGPVFRASDFARRVEAAPDVYSNDEP